MARSKFGMSDDFAGGSGCGRWRERKGIARVKLETGAIRLVELHWYEAHGVGAYEHKIKRYLD